MPRVLLTAEEKRERHKISQKKYYEKNREKKREYQKEYDEKNKEKKREYNQTPAGKKSHTISNWKHLGLICEDYDSLYAHYILAENCEECNVKFGEIGDGTNTWKCMDHSHETGLFRNFLCNKCNRKRG